MPKVMVVDDAFSELKVMESILKHGGCDVLTYIDGAGFEDKAALEHPDVILLDVVMPKRNGYEILRALKKDARTKQIPVVVVTSKNQQSDKDWARRQGADDYVTKPFTDADLLAAVHRFSR